jgi:CCR4-NOT transcription complex subunit 7/8
MEDFEKIKEITLEEAQKILPKNIAYMTMNDGEVIIVNGLDHDKFDKKEKDYESWIEEQSKMSKMNTGNKNFENSLHRIQEDTEENERNSNLINEMNNNLLKEKNSLKEGNNNKNNSCPINQGNIPNIRDNNIRQDIEINLNQKFYQDNKDLNLIQNNQNNNNYVLPKTNVNYYNHPIQQRQQFQIQNNINNINKYEGYNFNKNNNSYNNNYEDNRNLNFQRNNINSCHNNIINRNGQIMKLCQGTFINPNNKNINYLLPNPNNNNNGYIIYESYFRPCNSQAEFINRPMTDEEMQNRGINRYIRYNNHNYVEIKRK